MAEEEKPVHNGPGRVGDSMWYLDTLMVKVEAEVISDEDWRDILTGETATDVPVCAAPVPNVVKHVQQVRLETFHRLGDERSKPSAASFALVDTMSLITHLGDIPTATMGKLGKGSLAANEAESIQRVAAAKKKLESVTIRDNNEDYEYFCIIDRLTKDQLDHPDYDQTISAHSWDLEVLD